MTKSEFIGILQEYGCPTSFIEEAWRTRPTDELDEGTLRTAILLTRLQAAASTTERVK